jgi:hypothetical protein
VNSFEKGGGATGGAVLRCSRAGKYVLDLTNGVVIYNIGGGARQIPSTEWLLGRVFSHSQPLSENYHFFLLIKTHHLP